MTIILLVKYGDIKT